MSIESPYCLFRPSCAPHLTLPKPTVHHTPYRSRVRAVVSGLPSTPDVPYLAVTAPRPRLRWPVSSTNPSIPALGSSPPFASRRPAHSQSPSGIRPRSAPRFVAPLDLEKGHESTAAGRLDRRAALWTDESWLTPIGKSRADWRKNGCPDGKPGPTPGKRLNYSSGFRVFSGVASRLSHSHLRQCRTRNRPDPSIGSLASIVRDGPMNGRSIPRKARAGGFAER